MRKKRIPLYAFLCLFGVLTGLSLQNLLRANPITLVDFFCLVFSSVMTAELLVILHLVNPEEDLNVEVVGVE